MILNKIIIFCNLFIKNTGLSYNMIKLSIGTISSTFCELLY